jgi:hypothetical protein
MHLLIIVVPLIVVVGGFILWRYFATQSDAPTSAEGNKNKSGWSIFPAAFLIISTALCAVMVWGEHDWSSIVLNFLLWWLPIALGLFLLFKKTYLRSIQKRGGLAKIIYFVTATIIALLVGGYILLFIMMVGWEF